MAEGRGYDSASVAALVWALNGDLTKEHLHDAINADIKAFCETLLGEQLLLDDGTSPPGAPSFRGPGFKVERSKDG